MATLDTTPQIVDIKHYGGDTLTVKVTAPAEVTDGMTWAAQIKAARDAPTPDAEFDIAAPAASGDPAFLTLTAADSAALVAGTPVVTKRGSNGITRSVQQYVGVWDCQVSAAGLDPVRTLVQGSITLEMDVTRP